MRGFSNRLHFFWHFPFKTDFSLCIPVCPLLENGMGEKSQTRPIFFLCDLGFMGLCLLIKAVKHPWNQGHHKVSTWANRWLVANRKYDPALHWNYLALLDWATRLLPPCLLPVWLVRYKKWGKAKTAPLHSSSFWMFLLTTFIHLVYCLLVFVWYSVFRYLSIHLSYHSCGRGQEPIPADLGWGWATPCTIFQYYAFTLCKIFIFYIVTF